MGTVAWVKRQWWMQPVEPDNFWDGFRKGFIKIHIVILPAYIALFTYVWVIR